MPHDVFLSHSSKDKPIADAICALLERNGIRCWIAPRDILPGMDWHEAIMEAIKSSRVVILVFSSHANGSPQVQREIHHAFENAIVVLPFRVEAVEPVKALEFYIGSVHWLDALTPPLERHLNQLTQTVAKLTGRRIEPRSDEAPSRRSGKDPPKDRKEEQIVRPRGRAPWIRGLWALLAAALVICAVVFFLAKVPPTGPSASPVKVVISFNSGFSAKTEVTVDDVPFPMDQAGNIGTIQLPPDRVGKNITLMFKSEGYQDKPLTVTLSQNPSENRWEVTMDKKETQSEEGQ
jgi:hypothetical protein